MIFTIKAPLNYGCEFMMAVILFMITHSIISPSLQSESDMGNDYHHMQNIYLPLLTSTNDFIFIFLFLKRIFC